MVTHWLVESVDGWGRVTAPMTVVLGIVAGLVLSNVLHLTDQQMSNAASLAASGGAVTFFVYMFFVAPIRLWYKAEKELEQYRDRGNGLTLTVQSCTGNQIINNFFAIDARTIKAAMSGAGYVPETQTLGSHRNSAPKGQHLRGAPH